MAASLGNRSSSSRSVVVVRRDDETTILLRLSKARDQPPSEIQGHRRPQGLAERSWDKQRQEAVGGFARVVRVCEAWVHRAQSRLLDLGGL